MKLNFLVLTHINAIKCSDYEYLLISNWSKLMSSQISCPNQNTFLESKSPLIYDYVETRFTCNQKKKSSVTNFYVSNLLWKENNNNKHLSKKEIDRLSSTINMDNRNYSFKATMMGDGYRALVHNVSQDWSSNMISEFYTTFTGQPMICHIKLNLTGTVENEQCTNKNGIRSTFCYYEPLSKFSMQNVDWTRLNNFINDETYSPPNWRDQGGFYLDIRLLKTTTTSVSG